MISRFPADLPRIMALVAAVAIAGLGFGALWAEATWGRPSSTSGIGYLTVPAFAALFGLGGFLLGQLSLPFIARGAHKPREGPWVSAAAIMLIAAVGVTSALISVRAVRDGERASRPRVLLASAAVERVSPRGGRPAGASPAEAIWEWQPGGAGAPPETIQLPLGQVVLELSNGSAAFRRSAKRSIAFDLSPLEYITRIDAVPLDSRIQHGRSLAVAITGRATGHRLLLTVVNEEGTVLHAELLERCQSFDQVPLERWPIGDGKLEAAVVPRACETPVGVRGVGAAQR